MSQETLEMVRQVYETGAFDRFGLGGLPIAPDCEFVNPTDAVESGIRRGVDELRAVFRSTADAFDVSEHRAGRLFDAGSSVVAEVTFRGRGGASGAELAQEEVHTWTFREGKVIRFEWGRDLASALKAVGLGE